MHGVLSVEQKLSKAFGWLSHHLERQLHSLLGSGLFQLLGKNHQ